MSFALEFKLNESGKSPLVRSITDANSDKFIELREIAVSGSTTIATDSQIGTLEGFYIENTGSQRIDVTYDDDVNSETVTVNGGEFLFTTSLDSSQDIAINAPIGNTTAYMLLWGQS